MPKLAYPLATFMSLYYIDFSEPFLGPLAEKILKFLYRIQN